MEFYSSDEQEMIYHTFSCFKMSLLYLIKNGYGIVVTKEDTEDKKQYVVCNINGDLKILDIFSSKNKYIENGSYIKVYNTSNTIH